MALCTIFGFDLFLILFLKDLLNLIERFSSFKKSSYSTYCPIIGGLTEFFNTIFY